MSLQTTVSKSTKITDFQALRLRLASPEVIKSWSYGEVTKPETINYRTQKPEKAGLFAEEIFGPSKDWECYCGKYKRIRYKGIICDKCGVEVTNALVRRERMGHIELAAPACHIWFLRSVPSKIGLVLDISVQNLEKVIYFASYIVTEVNEGLKTETLEQLKKDYRSKQKSIRSEYKREAERVAKAGNQNPAEELSALEKMKETKLQEIENEYREAEQEFKNITLLKVISEDVFHEWSLKYGHIFNAKIGAEAIHWLLQRFNIEETLMQLEEEKTNATEARAEKIKRRIKLLKSLIRNEIKPEWMILTAIPIIPPDLRPMVPLDGSRFATSDLNDLYRRVINRNNRLKRLIELNAPEVIRRNEKRMLQEAVDALIDNSARHTKTVVSATGKKRQLKSLADVLKGKQGRFRQNLLGKRIDYSGRSVIVVGPRLKLHQCGLPKRMALELFRPFVINQLIKREIVHNIRSANRLIVSGRTEVWDILEEITREALVLLNRAPTLHRLGIQAFQPILIEGNAIRIHPLVCRAYNADFDGDQMAVHVPLTEGAKAEARELMLSTKNLLKPATGDPIIFPDKDVAWGCYYMTTLREPAGMSGNESDFEALSVAQKRLIKSFASPHEAFLAYQVGKISLQEKIRVRISQAKAKSVGNNKTSLVLTNAGRLILNRAFPLKIPFLNEVMDARRLGNVVRICLEYYGQERTAQLVDDIKEVGFYFLTQSGFSWSIDDLPAIPGKENLIKKAEQKIGEIENQYDEGLLTYRERYSKIIEVWTTVRDEIVKLCQQGLNPYGSVFSMVESGARGSWAQLTQMVGMKGLVTNPAGEIIELPVKKSFKEGFDVLEYFISTHGSRKGLADTAVRTASAGYLTRRLVDVAQDVVVRAEDCGDKEGITLTASSSVSGETLVSRAVGRYVLETITPPNRSKPIIEKGGLVTEETGRELERIEPKTIKVRSVLRCKLSKGICQKCYGYDLAYNKPVALGAAVGIIAAQSIGEPGTQLTMRTFHTGGVAGLDITQGLPRVEELFEVRSPKHKAFISDVAGKVKIEQIERDTIEIGQTGRGRAGKKILKKTLEFGPGQKVVKIFYPAEERDIYRIESGDRLKVKDGEKVKGGQVLLVKKSKKKIESKSGGTIEIKKKEVILTRAIDSVKEFVIPSGYVLWVREGDLVAPGDQLTEGDIDLHELFVLKGKEAVENYLLQEIKRIYASQGQRLNDKHLEVIIRQMFSRVYVKDSGDTGLLPGEIVERAELKSENNKIKAEKGKLAEGEEVFLGITRVSLSTRSFLSAASFQETARVLINAAVTGKIDPLDGLKENVIIGRLIPAGTGFRKGKPR